MDKLDYGTLNRIIKYQYKKKSKISENNQEVLMRDLLRTYNNPTSDNLLQSINTIIKSQKEEKIVEDDIDLYTYIHKS